MRIRRSRRTIHFGRWIAVVAPIIPVGMLGLVLLMGSVFRPVAFGEAPIRGEMLLGERLERKRKGVDRVERGDRAVLAKWFDGRKRQDADEVIWLSPGYISRWLGWMRAREGWTDDEVRRRWRLARDQYNGKLTFVVRVCALPRNDVINEEESPARYASDLDDVRGVLSYTQGKSSRVFQQGNALLLEKCVFEDPHKALSVDWEHEPALASVFGSTFAPSASQLIDPNLDFGFCGSTAAMWLVQFDTPKSIWTAGRFEFKAVMANKERTATYAVFHKRKHR